MNTLAHPMTRNPASGRVMQKLGMQNEGCMREHVIRWEKFEDVAIYGILSSEYKGQPSPSPIRS
jgi:RimJ/RimL family protein N-acetyltransferase